MTDCEMVALFIHVLEHETVGGAREIDPALAHDPNIPCRCFDYDSDSFCWKRGYLGLISSKRNPEQMAHCVIKEPAGAGVAERFEKVRGAARKAAQEYKGGGTAEWWHGVGQAMREAGVEL